MPGESQSFTTLVDPISPPEQPALKLIKRWLELVEAPGTAPGSETIIPKNVYRHSRLPDELNIGFSASDCKGLSARLPINAKY